jgi:hypothetical protein
MVEDDELVRQIVPRCCLSSSDCRNIPVNSIITTMFLMRCLHNVKLSFCLMMVWLLQLLLPLQFAPSSILLLPQCCEPGRLWDRNMKGFAAFRMGKRNLQGFCTYKHINSQFFTYTIMSSQHTYRFCKLMPV